MKKNFTLVCMAAALMLGVSSCSKDDATGGIDEGPEVVADGKEATVVVNLSFPKTYATDDNARPEESAVKNVDIFVINPENGAIVTHRNLLSTDTDLDDKGSNVWKATLKTTSGEKQILVGVNLPNSIRSAVAQSGIAGANADTVHEIAYGLLNDTDAGFAMFSTEVLEREIYSDEEIDEDLTNTKNNLIPIKVERMVARVSVQKASTVNISGNIGGTIDLDNLAFTLGKVNKKSYAMQIKNNLGVISDPNYLWEKYVPNNPDAEDGEYGNSDFFNPSETGEYILVNDYDTQNDQMRAKYATENVADFALRGTNTYLSVKANFIPTNISDKDGNETANPNTTTPETFWTVTLEDGTIRFFDDYDVAEEYETDNSANGAKLRTYEDGACYYRSYLSYNNGYNVLRNNFYKVTLTRINSLGNPDPDDDEEDEEGPIDGDFSTIEIDIDIVPWNMVEEGHELGK